MGYLVFFVMIVERYCVVHYGFFVLELLLPYHVMRNEGYVPIPVKLGAVDVVTAAVRTHCGRTRSLSFCVACMAVACVCLLSTQEEKVLGNPLPSLRAFRVHV